MISVNGIVVSGGPLPPPGTAGQVLTLDSGLAPEWADAAGGMARTNTYTFTPAGGAHDYTADTGWSGTQTPWFGDGDAVPHFSVRNTAHAVAMARTATGLRVTMDTTDTNVWPFTSDGAEVLVEIPQARSVVVTAVVQHNFASVTAPSGGPFACAQLGLYRQNGTDTPLCLCALNETVYGGSLSGVPIEQTVLASGSVGSAVDVSAGVVAGVLQRQIRLTVRGPEVVVESGPVGGPLVERVRTTTTTTPDNRWSASDLVLALGLAQGGSYAHAGLYAELQSLTVAVERW